MNRTPAPPLIPASCSRLIPARLLARSFAPRRPRECCGRHLSPVAPRARSAPPRTCTWHAPREATPSGADALRAISLDAADSGRGTRRHSCADRDRGVSDLGIPFGRTRECAWPRTLRATGRLLSALSSCLPVCLGGCEGLRSIMPRRLCNVAPEMILYVIQCR